MEKKFLTLIFFLLFALTPSLILASNLTSTSFIIKDPIIGTTGGYAASGSFTFFGTGNQNISGRNTSADYIGKYGFLYFGGVSPTPSPTPTPSPSPSGGGGGGGGGSGVIPQDLTKIPFYKDTNCRLVDFNCDGRVDILDLSILLFYYGKTGTGIARYDLSEDDLIDLADVSVLFYYWNI